mgnify:CR=1 FL=1
MRPLIIFSLIATLAICSLTLKGQTVKLLTLDELDKRIQTGKDTVYIVNFWATWCAPCLKELPHFEKLGLTLKGQKAKVLLVSLDFKSKLNTAVIPLAKRLKLKNELFLLDEQNQQAYIQRIDENWSGALPATLIINKTKNKREFHEREFTYEELIKLYHLNN